ncbi:MAG TPA: proline dehydrogenase family protein [Anaerolineaceae bacterium]
MLRSFFVSLSKASWAQRTITRWGFARRAAFRFVAGETSAEAVQVVRQLNGRGISASLDHLGENTLNSEDARYSVDAIQSVIKEIDRAGVQANVSIKLSQIGLDLDAALCRENMVHILETARSCGIFVRVDMEDSTLTDRTLAVVRSVHQQGYDNVGIVIQAYLRRSENDIRSLLQDAIRVRLCKGAYQESPNVAFPKKADVDANYDRLAQLLLEGTQAGGAVPASSDGRFPPIPAIATHDPHRIHFTSQLMDRLGLPKHAVEFQMLYGIRRDLQEQLAASGYAVRVYVPYGTHWYPYFMRRLGERPANIWFFVSNFFRK